MLEKQPTHEYPVFSYGITRPYLTAISAYRGIRWAMFCGRAKGFLHDREMLESVCGENAASQGSSQTSHMQADIKPTYCM